MLCPGLLCFLSFLFRLMRCSRRPILFVLVLSVILYKTKRYYSSVLSSLQIMYLSFWRYFGDYAVSRKSCVPYAVSRYLMPWYYCSISVKLVHSYTFSEIARKLFPKICLELAFTCTFEAGHGRRQPSQRDGSGGGHGHGTFNSLSHFSLTDPWLSSR